MSETHEATVSATVIETPETPDPPTPDAATKSEQAPQQKQRRSGAHLFEIDVVRSVTAICVIGVHAVSFTIVFTPPGLGNLAQNALISALHFTREIFLSITAFVMVYGYANRPLSFLTFWRKRGLGVLLPYLIWSVFYEVVNKPPLPPGPWLLRMLSDIFTGNASLQLYFILLSIEFYLILPWFLRFIVWAGKHPWRTLIISFGVQVALLTIDYNFVQTGPLSTTPIVNYIGQNESRWLPVYQFYMVIGGLAALYMPHMRAFMLRHGRWTIPALALGLTLLWGNLVYQAYITGQGIEYGISVFQPAMVIYAFAITAFLYWVAYRWAISCAPHPPHGYRFWGLLSDVSFGIYLVHAFVLVMIMQHLVPVIPIGWLEPLRVLIVWGLGAVITVAICVVMLYIPLLSRLIGRPCALRRDAGVGRWLDQRAAGVLRWLGRAQGHQRHMEASQ